MRQIKGSYTGMGDRSMDIVMFFRRQKCRRRMQELQYRCLSDPQHQVLSVGWYEGATFRQEVISCLDLTSAMSLFGCPPSLLSGSGEDRASGKPLPPSS